MTEEEKKAKRKEYYLNNKEKILKNIKEYRVKNKEKCNEISRKYHIKNKENISIKAKEYREKNKENISIKAKEYREKNKEKLKQYQKEWHSKQENIERRRKRVRVRYKNKIDYKIATNIRNSFRKALNLYYKTKKTKFLKEYGIDIKAIIEKLGEPPNDGKIYHIDHVFPVSAFDLNNPEHIKLCWHPDNLQWLEHIENISKNNKYDEENFKKYLNEHIVTVS